MAFAIFELLKLAMILMAAVEATKLANLFLCVEPFGFARIFKSDFAILAIFS